MSTLPPQEGFPKEHTVCVLRELSHDIYVEVEETWRRFRELGTDNELVRFSPTGRVFRLTRRVSQDTPPQPYDGEIRLNDCSSWEWVFFALERGEPGPQPFGFGKLRPEQQRDFGEGFDPFALGGFCKHRGTDAEDGLQVV